MPCNLGAIPRLSGGRPWTTSNRSVYFEFAQWMLREVAERRDRQGERLERGQRRFATSRSRKLRFEIRGEHISYGGSERFRDNDLSFRLALALRALEQVGETNWNACLTVAEYPVVAARLGRSKRRPKVVRLASSRSEVVQRAETVRALVNKYRKRFPEEQREQEFRAYLGMFRYDYARDEEWYEQEGDIVKCCGRGGSGGALFDQFSILEFLSF